MGTLALEVFVPILVVKTMIRISRMLKLRIVPMSETNFGVFFMQDKPVSKKAGTLNFLASKQGPLKKNHWHDVLQCIWKAQVGPVRSGDRHLAVDVHYT